MSELTRLRNSFPVLLTYLDRAWRRESDAALAPHNLSTATAMPLLAINRLGDGVRQVVLADVLGIEEGSMTQALHLLCGAGLVERRADPNDRRAKALHLTDAGRALTARVEAAMAGVRARLLADVPEADLAAAIRVFRAVEASVGSNKMPPATDIVG